MDFAARTRLEPQPSLLIFSPVRFICFITDPFPLLVTRVKEDGQYYLLYDRAHLGKKHIHSLRLHVRSRLKLRIYSMVSTEQLRAPCEDESCSGNN